MCLGQGSGRVRVQVPALPRTDLAVLGGFAVSLILGFLIPILEKISSSSDKRNPAA